ncbi:hypothetical protein DF164_31250 [Burkholderia stagnalis]|nr:hypothetical protein DF164_31250 [Burkholderia stagnalis]RQY64934.1 hypothetical protein DF110_30775 [Burkholderia stagnalis]
MCDFVAESVFLCCKMRLDVFNQFEELAQIIGPFADQEPRTDTYPFRRGIGIFGSDDYAHVFALIDRVRNVLISRFLNLIMLHSQVGPISKEFPSQPFSSPGCETAHIGYERLGVKSTR